MTCLWPQQYVHSFSVKNAVKNGPTLRKIAISGPCWSISNSMSVMSSKQYLKGQHWTVTALVKQFSGRNVDFVPKMTKKGPKISWCMAKRPQRVQIWVNVSFFWVFCLLRPKWVQLREKQLTKSQIFRLAGVVFGELNQGCGGPAYYASHTSG